MLEKIRNHWPIFGLLIISITLCLVNFTPNTFLSGWDTLHPEFNFGLNIQRAIFGVFRVEQGLGAVAAHSHMADLPRIMLLYLEHFILPLNFLRYSYIFLSMILGPIGMYLFLQKHLIKNKLASFLGALFYLLNLGTMQIFNVPFEMFTTLFATLPFIFLFATNFLKDKKNQVKNLLFFSIFILFTSPSAYAATLWYVFFGALSIYILSLCVVSKHKVKDGLILIILTLLINSFWLSPNIYFILNHAKEVQNANINLLFSDQAFLKNKEFGNLTSLLFLKSFYFDWNIYSGANKFTYLLSPYIEYLKNIPVILVGLGFGISFTFGGLYFIKKLKKEALPFIILLFVSLFFLINDNFPFSPLFKFLQDHLPYFKEALRFPDDKILNIYVFLISIFFSFFAQFVVEKLKKIKKGSFIFVGLITALLVFYNLPSFGGNFINKSMRIDIPKNYFQLFDYLNTQPSEPKVANFPINSPWGWVYYDWYKDKPSFQGAGFLYFGIKQPLLDRDFDRWSPYNESYYREMSYAIYKKDANLVKNVITKYDIGYIFIDKSVIDPQHPPTTLFFDDSQKLINQTGLVEDQKSFGKIILFKLKNNALDLTSINTNINVSPSTKTIYNDQAYDTFKNYITSLNSFNLNNVFYPFRDLIDNQSRINPKIVQVDNEKITFTPAASQENVNTENLLQNLSFIQSDLVLEKANGALNFAIYPNTPILDQTPLSRPLKGSVDIKNSSSNLILSVNENEIFNLDKLVTNTPFAIGKINLKNGENNISVFDQTGVIPIEDTEKKINPFFSNCQDQTQVSAIFSSTSINIKGKGDICILVPLGFFPNNELSKSILTNFGFDTKTNARIKACLFSQVTSQCLYYSYGQKNRDSYSFSFPLIEQNTDKRAIKFFFENPDKEQDITLTNFVSSYSKSISDVQISKNVIDNIFPASQNLTFNKIYLSSNVIYDPGFNVDSLNKLNNDCGSIDSNTKKEIININGQSLVKYTAKLGTFCDHFSYPNLLHKLGYLVIVESKNDSGLPLTLCLTNYSTRKCDIYTILSTNKTLKKEIFLLSPSGDSGIGYDVNLEALGINKSPAVNYLKTIEFVPIPFEFLINISKSSQTTTNSFEGVVESVKQFNPDMYLVKTNGMPTILDLNYSHELGFKAYAINCKNEISCFVKTLLTPLYGKEIEHVLVNNWANGWIVSGNNQIAIVFVPQYLEFLGFIIIIAIFLTLIAKLRRKI